MNHKCVFFLLILLFCRLCLGKPVLTFGDKARTYLNNRNQKLLKEFNQKKVVDSEKGYSYVVAIDEFTHKTIDEMKSFFLKTYNVYEIGNRILKIKKDNVKLDLSELKSHRASCALRMLKKVMPANYSNQFMLLSVDTERSFSKSQGVKVEGYRFNFSRLFNNRVVRNRDNFLMIRTDAKGVLKDIKIALQDLKVTSEVVKTDESVGENEETLDSLLNEKFDIIDIIDEDGFEKKEKIDKIDVGSVAEAYCEVFVGETKKLFPCLSYASKIKLFNSENISYIIDAPHSRHSWRKYNHENKGSARFSRYDR